MDTRQQLASYQEWSPSKAVVVPVTDEDELERFVLAHTPRFRRLLDAAERRIQKTGGNSAQGLLGIRFKEPQKNELRRPLAPHEHKGSCWKPRSLRRLASQAQ